MGTHSSSFRGLGRDHNCGRDPMGQKILSVPPWPYLTRWPPGLVFQIQGKLQKPGLRAGPTHTLLQ